MKKLTAYKKSELKALLDAVEFSHTWDEDHPEFENDPKKLLPKWLKRVKKALRKK